MAIADNAYSRFVFWLKVLLPLGALAILSTLFLLSETLDPNKAIPYADVDVEQILREQGLTRPTFGGTTASGATITLAADAVRPATGEGQRLRGFALNVAVEMPGGATVTIDSPSGEINFTEGMTSLSGGAVVASSHGYRIETDALTAALDRVDAATEGPVTASGPAGTIDAGRMTLTQRAETGAHVLVFKDGVRLVYDPKAVKE